MKFISEEIINPVIDEISDEEEVYERCMLEFSEAQPFLLSFLLSEGFNVLEEQEKSLMFYLAMIIYFSVHAEYPDPPLIELNQIQNVDEENWSEVDRLKLKSTKQIADHFFEDYKQEDLLAFVEDALMEDEEYQISGIGRNVIFVSMKSFIDVLHQQYS